MVTGINDSGEKVSYKDIVEAVKPMFEMEYVLVTCISCIRTGCCAYQVWGPLD